MQKLEKVMTFMRAEEQPKWVQDALYENSEDARSEEEPLTSTRSDEILAKRKGQ